MYNIFEKDSFIYIYSKEIDLSKLDSLEKIKNCLIIIKKVSSKIPIPTNNKQFISKIQDLEQKSINNLIIKQLAILKNRKEKQKRSCCDSINNNPNFISSLSHQIKTPLNGIISGLQIINSTLKTTKDQSIIKLLLNSSLELTTYVNDIIDYYLLAEKKITIKKESINLKHFIEKLINSYDFEIKKKNINFSFEINSNCPEIISIDQSRLFQVLNNIINNSIKFSQNEIIILEINFLENNNQLEFKIIDTGSGIHPNQLKLIWEPFYQVKDNWLTNQEGIGLGLTISKYLIELMGGTINIESSINDIIKGTKVNIKIPNQINIEENPNLETPKVDHLNITKKDQNNLNHSYNKFLIIDDNMINSTLLKLMITKCLDKIKVSNPKINNKPQITIFNNAKEGLNEILKEEYDCIFLDIKMPVFSGYDILKYLDTNSPAKINKIIIVSALITHHIKENTSNYPIKGILPKPIQLNELEKKLSA